MPLLVLPVESYLDRDRKSIVSKGLEAETARLLGGLPHWQQVPRTLQVKWHSFHHLWNTDMTQHTGKDASTAGVSNSNT